MIWCSWQRDESNWQIRRSIPWIWRSLCSATRNYSLKKSLRQHLICGVREKRKSPAFLRNDLSSNRWLLLLVWLNQKINQPGPVLVIPSSISNSTPSQVTFYTRCRQDNLAICRPGLARGFISWASRCFRSVVFTRLFAQSLNLAGLAHTPHLPFRVEDQRGLTGPDYSTAPVSLPKPFEALAGWLWTCCHLRSKPVDVVVADPRNISVCVFVSAT